MKLLTFFLILGVAGCALSQQIKPSTSAKINPLSIKATALKIARQTRLGQIQDYDFIGELIKALKDLDWNRVLDAFEVLLRNSKTDVQAALDELKALEISEEIKDGIISSLPGWAADRARDLSVSAIELSEWLVYAGKILGFPEVAIALAVALTNLYVFGLGLPAYLVWDVLDWINSQESGLGDQLKDVFINLAVNFQEELYYFLESLYQG